MPRDPLSYTPADRKRTLYLLFRRARHLDRKWAVSLKKRPDEFTILAMLPLVGDAMTSSLALAYIRKIQDTFILPDELVKEMYSNIGTHVGLAIIPGAGWILRRMYGVNKRNYKLLEEYLMTLRECSGSSTATSVHSMTGP